MQLAPARQPARWRLFANRLSAGGGEFARTLFEADVIDEVGFNVQAVLLGDGIPSFHRMSRQIDLELVSGRQFKLGCVLPT